jgi:hypothetical protein
VYVSVHGAKTQLWKLLDLIEDGEEVVIERHGRAHKKGRPSGTGLLNVLSNASNGLLHVQGAWAMPSRSPSKL